MKAISRNLGRFYGTVSYALENNPEISKKMNNVIKYEIETPIKESKGKTNAQLNQVKEKFETVPMIHLYPETHTGYIDNFMADEMKKVAEEPVIRK